MGDVFKFISNVLIEENVKMGVSIFFIEYGLMIEKICFFGVGSQNFPLKNSPFILFFFGGGSRLDWPKMGWGSIRQPKVAKFVSWIACIIL